MTRPRRAPARLMAVRLAAVLLVGAAPVLAGCGSEQEAYCDAVAAHREELTELIGSGEPDALLRALEPMRELAERAPDDIADEWDALIDAVDGFDTAIRDAGADPETYDPAAPPSEVTEAEQQRIRAAADRLADPETLDALTGIDQQVRDVCHTPLTL